MKINLNEVEKALAGMDKLRPGSIQRKVAERIVQYADIWIRNGLKVPVVGFPYLKARQEKLVSETEGARLVQVRV